MTLEEHTNNLGKLIVNFHSLEFMLRNYLQKNSSKSIGTPYGVSFYTYPVDTELPENEITNYDSLGQLINKFNAIMRAKKQEELDYSLVEIRDALAHGRISAQNPETELQLIKFSKPINGKVKVVFNQFLTEEWFTFNRARLYYSIELVCKHYQ
jgi:hypothetical protein